MPRNHIVLLSFLAYLFFGNALAGILIKSPPEIAGFYRMLKVTALGTPLEPNVPPQVPFDGIMAAAGNPQAYGNIVLASAGFGSFDDPVVDAISNYLPKAFIYVEPYPVAKYGWARSQIDDWQQTAKWTLPLGVMPLEDGAPLLDFLSNTTAEVTLIFEENPWEVIANFPGWIISTQVLSAAALIVWIFAILRLRTFVSAVGFQFSLAQVVLVIQIVINPFITLFWILNAGLLFPLFGGQAEFFTERSTIHSAVTICLILTAFFWCELSQITKIRASIFISSSFKIPTMVIMIGILALTYGASLSQSLGGPLWQFMASTLTSLNFCILFLCVVYLIVTIVITFKTLSNSNNPQVKKFAKRFLSKYALLTIVQAARMAPNLKMAINGWYSLDVVQSLNYNEIPTLLWIEQSALVITNYLLIASFIPPAKMNRSGYYDSTPSTALATIESKAE